MKVMKELIFKRVYVNLFQQSSLPNNLRMEFKNHCVEINFQRTRLLVIILFFVDWVLLLSDYFNYQKGVWGLNEGYRLLFQTHVALGIAMLSLIGLDQLFSKSLRWQGSFPLITTIYLLSLASYISGGVDQLLHQQITVYILAAFTISALIYLRPLVSLCIYFGTYVLLVGCLLNNQLDFNLVKGHLINGALLALLAWFFSVTLYNLRVRDFLYQMKLEEMVEERTAMLKEVNCQLEEEISERSRLDEEMTHFFKAIPDLICFLSFDGVLTRVNDAFSDLLGYIKEDVVMKPLIELVHPEDQQRAESSLKECIQNRMALTKLENRLRCQEGQYVSIDWTIVPDFERYLIFAVGRDITEKNQNQKKIYRLASIVESTDDGIIGMTTDGVILDWNQGAERVYGYKAEEMIGNSIMTIITEERCAEVEELIRKVLCGEKITHFETLRRHKDGRIIDVSLTISPIKDNTGKVIGISSIIRDIGENKRMERELSRLDRLNLIGEMAASISHEVRNPMTTVRGFMQLLYNKESCIDQRPYFDLMIEELDRANSILTEFLSISRTKMTERRKQNLNAIVRSLVPLIEASAVGRNQSVRTELMDIPDLALDDKEIRQVILNLSRNALEAMDEGKLLQIRTYTTPEEVVLEVRDEGKGISPESIQKLGTPFFTTKDNGTGLGLAVCFGIVTRHDGRIEVESGETGSVFYVKFKR